MRVSSRTSASFRCGIPNPLKQKVAAPLHLWLTADLADAQTSRSPKFRHGLLAESSPKKRSQACFGTLQLSFQPFFSSFLFVTFITSKSLQRLLRALYPYKTIEAFVIRMPFEQSKYPRKSLTNFANREYVQSWWPLKMSPLHRAFCPVANLTG